MKYVLNRLLLGAALVAMPQGESSTPEKVPLPPSRAERISATVSENADAALAYIKNPIAEKSLELSNPWEKYMYDYPLIEQINEAFRGIIDELQEALSLYGTPPTVISLNGDTFGRKFTEEDTDLKLLISAFPESWAAVNINPANITSMILANNIPSWPQDILAGCTNLQSITVCGPSPHEPSDGSSETITLTWQHLSSCLNLTSIQIPESITKIGEGRQVSGYEDEETGKLCLTYEVLDCDGGFACGIFPTVVPLSEGIEIPDEISGDREAIEAFLSAKVTSISFPKTLSSIGSFAFASSQKLTFLDLSACSNLTKIGSYAFGGCIGVTSLALPASLRTIGEGAFCGCVGLTSLDLSGCKNLRSVGPDAFASCPNITSITLPAAGGLGLANFVTALGVEPSQIQKLSIPNTISDWPAEALDGFTNLQELTRYEVEDEPDLVPEITLTWQHLASCHQLTKLEMPDTVVHIGEGRPLYVYEDEETGREYMTYEGEEPNVRETDVASSIFPTQLSLRGKASDDADLYLLLSKIGSISFSKNLTSIGDFALSLSVALTSVDFSECHSLTEIGSGTFLYDFTLNSVAFPPALKTLGEQTFAVCSSLASIDLSPCTELEEIKGGCFYECRSLESVEFPPSLKRIARRSFEGYIEDVTWGRTPAEIAFINGDGNEDGVALDHLGDIGFSGDCQHYLRLENGERRKLEFQVTLLASQFPPVWQDLQLDPKIIQTLTISNAMTAWPQNALAECTRLETLLADGAAPAENAEEVVLTADYLPNRENLKKVQLPTLVTSIGSGAFSNCAKLESVEIPASVTKISQASFDGCGALWEVILNRHPNAITFVDADGVEAGNVEDHISETGIGCYFYFLREENGELSQFGFAISGEAVASGEETAQLSLSDFPPVWGDLGIDPTCLRFLTIPNNLTDWPVDALGECAQLEELLVDEADPVEEGEATIELSRDHVPFAETLETIQLPSAVRSIGEAAFAQCSCLVHVTFPPFLEGIGNSAFAGCPELTSVDLSPCTGLVAIEQKAFLECANLTTVTFPASIQTIDSIAFGHCPNLATVYWHGDRNAVEIAQDAFLDSGVATHYHIEESGELSELP